MSPKQTKDHNEPDALRARIDALEEERARDAAAANAALAAAQDRSYWLDRWQIDLNSLMARPGAGEARAALRGLRSVFRVGYDLSNRLRAVRGVVEHRVAGARGTIADERELAQSAQDERFRRSLSPDRLTAAPITELLYERLTDEDLAAIEERLGSAEGALWETAVGVDRKRLALAFAAHFELDAALGRTGLSAVMPPAGVHAMAQGAAAAGGSTYYADLVADALAQTGLELGAGQAGLDFGCSSARVVRVLAAAAPEVEWHGCDPIPDAIEWASASLPGVAFARSPEYPPLPYEDGKFDFVYAISIWSHFAEPAALAWLDEMRRILKPGGRLLLTTHGEHTITHTHGAGVRTVEQLDEVRAAMFEHGFWYAAEFGEQGDHGVANPDWGTAFLTPEWLLTRLTPTWRVALYRPGRVEDNQDLFVLERT